MENKTKNVPSYEQNIRSIVTEHQTSIRGQECNLVWKVKEMKYTNVMKTGEYLTSPEFQTDFGTYNIYLYPKGIKDYCKDHISISLVANRKNVSKPTFFSITLIHRNNPGKDVNFNDVFDNRTQQKIDKFVKIDADFITSFVTSDNYSLTITLQLQQIISVNQREGQPKPILHENPAKCQLKELVSDFERLLQDDQLTDVKLLVDHGEFQAHKNILAARSRVFRTMFNGDKKEKQTDEVRLEGINSEVMQEVLRFMYTGKVNNIETMAMDLLIAADKYQINGLKTMCEYAIISSLSLENVADTLLFADRLNFDKVKTAAIEFVVINSRSSTGIKLFTKIISMSSPSLRDEIIEVAMPRM